MKKLIIRFAAVSAALTFCILMMTALAGAQEFRGTVNGSVTDPNGASVPGAVVAIGRLCTGKIDPTRGGSRPRDESRSSTRERLEHVLPRNGVAALSIRGGQDEIPRRIRPGNDERVSRTRCGRHEAANDDGLKFGHDTRRAWRAAVVNPVPAVPTRTASAHLRDPRPDVFRWGIDGDRVRRREQWVGHHAVGRKRAMPFDLGRKTSGERHNTVNAAFGVPRPQSGRRPRSGAAGGIPVLTARPPPKSRSGDGSFGRALNAAHAGSARRTQRRR